MAETDLLAAPLDYPIVLNCSLWGPTNCYIPLAFPCLPVVHPDPNPTQEPYPAGDYSTSESQAVKQEEYLQNYFIVIYVLLQV